MGDALGKVRECKFRTDLAPVDRKVPQQVFVNVDDVTCRNVEDRVFRQLY